MRRRDEDGNPRFRSRTAIGNRHCRDAADELVIETDTSIAEEMLTLAKQKMEE
jgi:hypothetical protein